MAPAHKGTVSAEHRAKLRKAVEGIEKARAARDDAVREALLAGGSIRAVAEAAGMSTSTVAEISAQLPTTPTKERMAKQRADAQAWRQKMAAAEEEDRRRRRR